MKRFFLVLLSFFLLLSFGSCSQERVCRGDFFAFDTYHTVSIYGMSEPEADALLSDLEAETRALENVFSFYLDDSELARLNRERKALLSDPLYSALLSAAKIKTETNGAFSPTLGALTSLWGVGREGFLPPAEKEIAAALAASSPDLTLSGGSASLPEGMLLDAGGFAKGVLAERLVEKVRASSCSRAVLSLGGNVGVYSADGSYEFRIGITDPHAPEKTAGYLLLRSGFLSVSGHYERYSEYAGQRYSHILDPRTGRPADSDVVSAAVWSEDGLLADALSTAFVVMGREEALAFFSETDREFGAVLFLSDGTVALTDNLKGSFVETP
ncbi:MAG: FAD:protein FMN transferase [Clostridia bacterium]|nr:FAD:protein FMN transferase [Clostridia bacterium]